MMVFSPLDEEEYDSIARKMTYWKIFEYILEDFVSRKDAKEMMKSSNLPVSTTVSTTVNTVVAVSPPTGTGTGVGAGNGSGSGNTQPIYVGETATPGSVSLKEQHERELESGGVQIEGLVAATGVNPKSEF